jgi:hypothetical protein
VASVTLRLFALMTAAYAVLVACAFTTVAALFAAISGHPWPEIGFGLAAIATYRAYPFLDERIDRAQPDPAVVQLASHEKGDPR